MHQARTSARHVQRDRDGDDGVHAPSRSARRPNADDHAGGRPDVGQQVARIRLERDQAEPLSGAQQYAGNAQV